MLTLIDEFSRQCLKIEVGRKLKSKDVLDALAEAMAERGVPHHIRSDNGPEFIARDVQDWLAEMGICTIYIDPGSPWQNGYSERFDSRFRDGCVNREWLLKIEDSITTQKGRIADGAI